MTDQPLRVAVLGGGSFGTALASIAADNGARVRQWLRDPALAEQINREHVNGRYLPDYAINPAVVAATGMAESVPGSSVAVSSSDHGSDRSNRGGGDIYAADFENPPPPNERSGDRSGGSGLDPAATPSSQSASDRPVSSPAASTPPSSIPSLSPVPSSDRGSSVDDGSEHSGVDVASLVEPPVYPQGRSLGAALLSDREAVLMIERAFSKFVARRNAATRGWRAFVARVVALQRRWRRGRLHRFQGLVDHAVDLLLEDLLNDAAITVHGVRQRHLSSSPPPSPRQRPRREELEEGQFLQRPGTSRGRRGSFGGSSLLSLLVLRSLFLRGRGGRRRSHLGWINVSLVFFPHSLTASLALTHTRSPHAARWLSASSDAGGSDMGGSVVSVELIRSLPPKLPELLPRRAEVAAYANSLLDHVVIEAPFYTGGPPVPQISLEAFLDVEEAHPCTDAEHNLHLLVFDAINARLLSEQPFGGRAPPDPWARTSTSSIAERLKPPPDLSVVGPRIAAEVAAMASAGLRHGTRVDDDDDDALVGGCPLREFSFCFRFVSDVLWLASVSLVRLLVFDPVIILLRANTGAVADNELRGNDLDQMLIADVKRKESEWRDFSREETNVKIDVAELIFGDLLGDTVAALDELEARRAARGWT